MKWLWALIIYIPLSSCLGGKTEPRDENTESSGYKNYSITHFNITVAPDLSNRLNQKLYPKLVSDEAILDIILKNIYPTILNHQRSENQKDKFSVSFINNLLIAQYNITSDNLNIDFETFDTQRKRIDYIKNRLKTRTFSKDTSAFKNELKKMYAAALDRPHGADIFTYLNSRVDDTQIALTDEPYTTFKNKSYANKYRNILILITDGYIEAGIYGQDACTNEKVCYYLSKNRIDKFRIDFLKSGEADIETFFQKNDYGIMPLKNDHLKNVEILVLEMYDRSLTKDGNATVHPTDGEIMKLFWSDWLTKANVKRFKLVDIASSEYEMEKVILNFLGINDDT